MLVRKSAPVLRPTKMSDAETISVLHQRIEDRDAEIAGLRERIDDINRERRTSAALDDLIAARRAIKAGRIDDALYEIDRTLSRLDRSWRTRA